MTRKRIIILISISLAVIAIAAVCFYIHHNKTGAQKKQLFPTDDAGYAVDDVPHADSEIVGKWHSANKQGWHKVYYDDYDAEMKMFWGKEWHEEDSVVETDLAFHGNGWFRWERKKKMLHEYATMNICDVPIHRVYKIRKLTADSIIYFEPDYKNTIYRFGKE